MRPQAIKSVIKTMFNTSRRTLCLEGAPGGGKTTIVKEVAAEMGVPCIVKHMPTMLVEDFGILFPSEGSDTLRYKLPDWFPVAGQAPEKGILLFDDSNQAGADLQKVMANICQERTLHGTPMPEGWMVIRTGNRQSDRAGANKILTHLRNRETVIEYETHLQDWVEWAITHDVHPIGIGFISARPDLLHHFDANRDVNPTPRSWVEGVFNLIDALPSEVEYEVFKGAVGEGEAADFTGFLKIYREMIDPERAIQDPEGCPIPEKLATRYAMAMALVHRAEAKTIDAIITYVDRMPKEIAVLAIQQIQTRDPSLLGASKRFQKWAMENHSWMI